MFYIRKTRTNRRGEAPVLMRITVDGVRVDTTIKKTIAPALWDSVRGKAIEKTQEARELNLYMDAIRFRITRIQREMELDSTEYVTAQMVLNRYLGRDVVERHTVLEVFREHNEKCRALSEIDMAPATVQIHVTCLKHMHEFIRNTYKRDDIYLDEMSHQFIVDYEFFLKTVQKCSHNTTTKYLKNFKKITRMAIQKEWLKKDPFADIKFSMQPVERDFLEKHEIKKLIEKTIAIERLGQVRDIFAFCSFTGLAFSDVKQLTSNHIYMDINGAKWIRKPRQKTKNMCNIPLMDVPLQILKKYKNHPECIAKGVLLPVPSNQKMNAYLKELADICGIKKQLTTHVARHTFATFALANGVSMENVAKMLGHSDTKMTHHYAKILDSTIMKEITLLEKSYRSIFITFIQIPEIPYLSYTTQSFTLFSINIKTCNKMNLKIV